MKVLDPQRFAEAIRRIVKALQPEAVYLFGSHAYGEPREDSDVDLLVVVGNSEIPSHRRAAVAYGTLRGLCFPVDIKVVTRIEFERRAQYLSSIERIVRSKGKIVYETRVG